MTAAKFYESLIAAAFFAFAYFLTFLVQINVLKDFDFLPMASILFIPAGIKFVALLVGGGAGVVGLTIGWIFVEQHLGSEFELGTALSHTFVWLLLPYICMTGYLKKYHLKSNLENLTAYHVLVLAMILSFVSSLGTQLLFVGLPDINYPLLKGIWSMSLGDFSGILVSLGLVLVVRRVIARSRSRAAD